jgi:hypothetical protein
MAGRFWTYRSAAFRRYDQRAANQKTLHFFRNTEFGTDYPSHLSCCGPKINFYLKSNSTAAFATSTWKRHVSAQRQSKMHPGTASPGMLTSGNN